MSEDSTPNLETTVSEQTPENSPEMPDRSYWHKTSRLPDGTPIGRLGAYWYILNEDGSLMSDGYHEVFLDENGGYRGTFQAYSTESNTLSVLTTASIFSTSLLTGVWSFRVTLLNTARVFTTPDDLHPTETDLARIALYRS